MAPDILIVGQITVDDVVPSRPGLWRRQLGGNSLYATAGARLWCDPKRIGIVARLASSLPFDVPALLESAGLSTAGLRSLKVEPLVEWIVYEEDSSRQSMPRNIELRDPTASRTELFARYLRHLERLSASFGDIPEGWLPACAIHLAPQVLTRHQEACRTLKGARAFVSVDPSPHYSIERDAPELVMVLPGVSAFLPSLAEVQHLMGSDGDLVSLVRDLCAAGFPEVVLKIGGAGALVGQRSDLKVRKLPAAAAVPVDLTGAGDAFGGAYAASRALGFEPVEAAQRAIVAAAMVTECSGADEALRLQPACACSRLQEYVARKMVGDQEPTRLAGC
jgi:hypothetical protein